VLHHFPTKDALISAVVEHAMQLQAGVMRELVRPGGLAAIERIAAWGEIIEETPELVALQVLLSSEALLEDAKVRDYVLARYEAVHDLATGLLREAIERGEVRPDTDVEWEATALIAYLDGIRLQWFYSDRRLPIGAAVRQYVALLVERLTRGLAPPTSGPPG
jgi:AcrR family transcriptional regulator